MSNTPLVYRVTAPTTTEACAPFGHAPFCLCRACDDASWEFEKQLLARRPPQTGTRLLPRTAHSTFTDGAGI